MKIVTNTLAFFLAAFAGIEPHVCECGHRARGFRHLVRHRREAHGIEAAS